VRKGFFEETGKGAKTVRAVDACAGPKWHIRNVMLEKRSGHHPHRKGTFLGGGEGGILHRGRPGVLRDLTDQKLCVNCEAMSWPKEKNDHTYRHYWKNYLARTPKRDHY